jgi:hypothetical protein
VQALVSRKPPAHKETVKKKKIQLIDAVKRFGKFLRAVNVSNDASRWDPTAPEYFFTRQDLTVLLTGNDAETYRGCLRDLYDSVAEKQILSRDAVQSVANDTCANIFTKGMTLSRDSLEFQAFCDNEIKELRKALERKPETWEVISRVCGIEQVGLPVKFGKVTFVFATPDVLDSIPEATITRPATKHLGDNVLSRVNVQAVDVDAARAAATRVLQQTIDCLNFFAAIASVSGQAYLLGEKSTGHGFSISISNNNVSHHSFLYGPFQPLPFGRLMELPGFGRISKMLESDKPEKLEDRILRATQWAGRAFVDSRREESFLLMAIALESLLLENQNNENITYKVAMRCAHLIGKADLEARQRMVRDIKDLYSRRSMIVHSGKIEVSDAELGSLRHYLSGALFVVLNKEPFCSMKEENELETWFEERLLEVQVPNH